MYLWRPRRSGCAPQRNALALWEFLRTPLHVSIIFPVKDYHQSQLQPTHQMLILMKKRRFIFFSKMAKVFWKNGDLDIFFSKMAKGSRWWPLYRTDKTSPTAGSPRGRTERRLVKPMATRTTNLRSAALAQKRCLAGNRRLVEHGDNNYSLELLFSQWETNLSHRNRGLKQQLCPRLPQV